MTLRFRKMKISDYDAALHLWKTSEGVGLSEADSRMNIGHFLAGNPCLSFVAVDNSKIVGVVLCGTDGRRGYIHHLAVEPGYRRRSIGRKLVEKCIAALKSLGINKCHILVFKNNKDAIEFWKQIGWSERYDLIIMSRAVK